MLTNGISVKFEIWSIYAVPECAQPMTKNFCKCLDSITVVMCKISLWSAKYAMNKSIVKFLWIFNLIPIWLVGWVPGYQGTRMTWLLQTFFGYWWLLICADQGSWFQRIPPDLPRGCFKNAYGLLNQRALKILMHENIFLCMGQIFCVELQWVNVFKCAGTMVG